MITLVVLVMGICPSPTRPVKAQGATENIENSDTIVIDQAVMCEGVKDGLPVNQTLVFDVSKGTAYCWSNFDPVISDGVIFHEWYRKGELISRKKLAVHKPKWATYSSLRLREADIGPWQLKIVDDGGNILKTLRFSITE